MKGQDLFDFYVSKGGEYGQTLFTAFFEIGDKLFPMLEKAEKAGKKIILVDDPELQEADDTPFSVEIGG